MTPEGRIMVATAAMNAVGYDVQVVEWCEDSRTPGLLGQIAGVTDHEHRVIKISERVNDTAEKIAAVMAHELHHVLDPDWDCGNRDVLGRGGDG